MNKKERYEYLHPSFDRGIYLVRYTGKGRIDKPKARNKLWIPTGACKFGQSLHLKDVKERYEAHFKEEKDEIQMHILAEIQNRDDIDKIEKKLHEHFNDRRLRTKDKDGNPKGTSEWMESIDSKELKKAFKKIFLEHFHVSV
jgi:hypothetical protein